MASSQLAFYKYIVAPLYSAMDELVPVGHLQANLAEMRMHWEEVLRQQDGRKQQQGGVAGSCGNGAPSPTQREGMADYLTVSGHNAAEPTRRRRSSRTA